MSKRFPIWMILAALLVAPLRAQEEEPAPEQEPTEEVVEEVVEAEAEETVVEEVEEEVEEAVENDSPWLAVVGGDLYTVTDGVIRGGTVLSRDGIIIAVGNGIKVPEGARMVDATGMRVYPGLIGVTTRGITRVDTKGVDNHDPYALNQDLALTGGLTTVENSGAIVKLKRGTLDGLLVGETGWVRLNVSTTSPASRRRVATEFGKVRDFLRQRRAFDTAKKLGHEDTVDEPDPKKVNKDYLALLEGKKRAYFAANSLKDLLLICDFLDEYPMQSVIEGGREAWACAGRLGRIGARLIVLPRDKAYADDSLNRPSGWSIENAKILWEHGVKFSLIPADTPYGGVQGRGISTGGIAGRDMSVLPMAAAFAIRGGLPQDAALRALTLDAAEILGVDDRLGSLEPGKDADMSICDGDLFHYRTFVQWSVIDGLVIYDKQLMPYFAHIRPRAEAEAPSAEEVIGAIQEAIAEQVESAEVESTEVESGEGNR